jgi:O-antigen ligase
MNSEARMRQGDLVTLLLASTLLLIAFMGGGDSAHANLGTMAAQLFAIPVLIHAALQATRRGRLGSLRWEVLCVLLIVLLPLLQLLPLPMSLWSLPAARASLLQDLVAVGVASGSKTWSLSPAVTERALLFLLPGLALFFSMLAVGRIAWQRMLVLLIGLSVGNLVFALIQAAAGRDSFLNPYPDFVPALGGIFANSNHQADIVAIGLMLVVVLLFDAWKQFRAGRRSIARAGAFFTTALILVAALPSIGSRAGVIVAMIMLGGAFMCSGWLTLNSFRQSRLLQVGSALALVVFLVALKAGLGWLEMEAIDPATKFSRYRIASETVRIGAEYAPLGSGFGTFIPAFQQGASDDFLMHEYVNNAHNDYAQWWLEGGIAGVLVTLLALAILLKTLIRLLRQRLESTSRVYGMAAMMGIGVIVLHSTVDYPLRTPGLLAVFAVMAGIAIGAASKGASSGSRSRSVDSDPPDRSRIPRANRP